MGAKLYVLAHELEIEFTELMDLARQEDIKVSSHMATLSSEQVEHLRNVAEKRALDVEREQEAQKRSEESDRREAQEKRKIEELAAKAEAAIGRTGPKLPPMATATAPPQEREGAVARKVPEKKREKKKDKKRDGGRSVEAAKVPPKKKQVAELPGVSSEAEISLPATVKDVSQALGIKAGQIISALMKNHQVMVTINQPLTEDLIETIALEFERMVKIKKKEEIEEVVEKVATRAMARPASQRVLRPPVVAFLGHVDHGKTSLLDRLRDAQVADGEAGGITQHIGSYTVDTAKGGITFIDTPGHEAFAEMRSRGAQSTDIVVLVVAADDGVMPQTVEAISHAKAAGVPIIVAMNKIDKQNANPDKAKGQLAQEDLAPDDWGGTTPVVPCSALTGDGIDDLLDMIHLVSEMAELKADPKGPGAGVVLEAAMTEGRGIVTTLLVRDGTLKKGDAILCDVAFGRIRSMSDWQGKKIEEAGPSMPVQITGLDAVPMAGEQFYVFEDAKKAKEVAGERKQRAHTKALAGKQTRRFENLFESIQAGQKTVAVVVKADVQGSLEVLKKELTGLSTDEVKVEVKHGAVGGINESDVLLAETSNGVVIGFNVVPEDRARRLAEQKKVEIRRYNVIYEVLDDMKKAMEGLLEPEEKEEILGQLEVREIFSASRLGKIAGCYVTGGTIERKGRVRLIRDNVIIYEGGIASLRRFKDDAKEVREGFECGLRIEGYDDVKVGDRVECFQIIKIARTLS